MKTRPSTSAKFVHSAHSFYSVIFPLAILLLLTASPRASAQELFTETWSELKAGDNVMDSGHWTMGTGSADQFVIVEDPTPKASGLFLSARPDGRPTPIILSIGRYPLAEGLAVSVEAALGDEQAEFQFGIRPADAGGGSVTGSYRVLVKANEISLNRFPLIHQGPQKVLGSHTLLAGDFKIGEFYTITLQTSPLTETKTRLEVFLGDRPIISVVSTATDPTSLPHIDGDVRLFFLPGGSRNVLVQEISVIKGNFIP